MNCQDLGPLGPLGALGALSEAFAPVWHVAGLRFSGQLLGPSQDLVRSCWEVHGRSLEVHAFPGLQQLN